MNRTKLPLILMLIAGAITAIMTLTTDYSLLEKMLLLLIVLLVFYFIGRMIQNMLDSFDRQNEKAAQEEGEVIEKENASGEESSSEEGEASQVRGEGTQEN